MEKVAILNDIHGNLYLLNKALAYLRDKNISKYLICGDFLTDGPDDNKIIDILLDPSTPELILNKEVTDFFDFDNSKELSDVKLVKYKHMGKIPMPIAQ